MSIVVVSVFDELVLLVSDGVIKDVDETSGRVLFKPCPKIARGILGDGTEIRIGWTGFYDYTDPATGVRIYNLDQAVADAASATSFHEFIERYTKQMTASIAECLLVSEDNAQFMKEIEGQDVLTSSIVVGEYGDKVEVVEIMFNLLRVNHSTPQLSVQASSREIGSSQDLPLIYPELEGQYLWDAYIRDEPGDLELAPLDRLVHFVRFAIAQHHPDIGYPIHTVVFECGGPQDDVIYQ